MFDAQLLRAGSATSSQVYSPWFSRAGDHARFTLDVVRLNTGSSLEVAIFHKSSEDGGDGVQLDGGLITRESIGRTTKEYANMKDLVRYRFTAKPAIIGATPEVFFRMLGACWFDAVRSS